MNDRFQEALASLGVSADKVKREYHGTFIRFHAWVELMAYEHPNDFTIEMFWKQLNGHFFRHPTA